MSGIAVFMVFVACSGPGATTTATSTTTSTTTAEAAATDATRGSTDSETGATTSAISDASSDPSDPYDPCSCTFLCSPADCGDDPWDPIQCDVWTQDCPAGEKCSAWANDGGNAWNATKCVPVARDPAPIGEPCAVEGSEVSGIDTCAAGTMCWDVDPRTNTGRCVALCVGDVRGCLDDPWGCCPEGSFCVISNNGTLNLCHELCHPLQQACEDTSKACYPVAGAFLCADDTSGDQGAPGDPCLYINACEAGTYCADPETFPDCDPMAPGCCVPFCDLDAPVCPPGTECTPWYAPMEALEGFDDLGACVIPE